MDNELLSKEEWTQFFDLIRKIHKAPGTWQQKSETIEIAVVDNNATDEFDEFLCWF